MRSRGSRPVAVRHGITLALALACTQLPTPLAAQQRVEEQERAARARFRARTCERHRTVLADTARGTERDLALYLILKECPEEAHLGIASVWRVLDGANLHELRLIPARTAGLDDARIIEPLVATASDTSRPRAVRRAALTSLVRIVDPASVFRGEGRLGHRQELAFEDQVTGQRVRGAVPITDAERASIVKTLARLGTRMDDVELRDLAATYARSLRARAKLFEWPKQRGILAGGVTNERGEPMARVQLRVRESRGLYATSTYTDENGRYRLDSLPGATYEVEAFQYGGRGQSRLASVWYTSPARVDFTLEESLSDALGRDDDRLQSATWQPRVHLATSRPPSRGLGDRDPQPCHGVDSIIVTPPTVTVVGYASDGDGFKDITAHVMRRGNALVLDLFDRANRQANASVVCVRWVATIEGLAPAHYALSVRDAGDPRGAYATSLLAFQYLDSRKPKAWDASAVRSFERRGDPPLEP